MKTSSRPILVASFIATCSLAYGQNTTWIAPSGSDFNDNASWNNNAPGINTGRAEIAPTGTGTQIININAGSEANDIRFSGGTWEMNGTVPLLINSTGNNELRGRFGSVVDVNVEIQAVGTEEFAFRPINSGSSVTSISLNNGFVGAGNTIAKAGTGTVIFNSNIDGGSANRLFVTRGGVSVLTDNFSTTDINRIRVRSGGTIDTTGVTGGFNLASGISLQGDGLVTGNVNFTGILDPRGTSDAPATLTFANDLTTDLGGTWLMDLESMGASDFISVGGDLNVSGGTLDISSTSIGVNDTVVFADYGGSISGTFQTVMFNGSVLTSDRFTLDYGFGPGNQVAFTLLVPEVSSVLPITACMLPLAFFRRRSRKEA